LQRHYHSDRHVLATGGLGCTGSQHERATHGEKDMEWEEAVHNCFVSFMIDEWVQYCSMSFKVGSGLRYAAIA
jgi:hypothetical protein